VDERRIVELSRAADEPKGLPQCGCQILQERKAMNAIVRVVLISLLGMTAASDAYARKWADVTGRYAVEADLIARNDELAVLQRVDDKKLVSANINELSKEDQQYLNENRFVESDRAAEGLHDWNLSNGLKVRARVVGYGRRELVLQRRSGKLLVNDRRFENLPEIYQRMIPKIVGHINKSKIDSPESLQRWNRYFFRKGELS
jgi:hypothetical protein